MHELTRSEPHRSRLGHEHEHALAVDDYAKAIELTPHGDPERSSLHRWRAQSLDQLGRGPEAERDRQSAEGDGASRSKR